MAKTIFNILCVLVLIAEAVIVYMIVKAKKEKFPTRLLNCCFGMSAVTIISYVSSINCSSYFLMSLTSSFYFCSIDILLLHFSRLITRITDTRFKRWQRCVQLVSYLYAIFDCTVLLVNPFHEIAITYTVDPDLLHHWSYEPMLLYNLHLIFCYLLILKVIFYLLTKLTHTPALYHSRYTLIVEAILLVVLLNCFFLYAPILSAFKYDISVLLYGGILMIVYYNSIYYADKKLLREAHNQILMEFSYPIVLFDYERKFVSGNHASMELFYEKPDKYTIDEFTQRYGLDQNISDFAKSTSFKWVYDKQLYRCEYQTLTRKNEIIGYVFSFNEMSTEIDLLTGFYTSAAAIRDLTNRQIKFPAGVLLCDPAGLSIVNDTWGRDTGDRMIRTVAEIMRSCCPKETYFARLHDAVLMAVCPSITVGQMKMIMADIIDAGENTLINDEKIHIISAFSMCTVSQPFIRSAMSSAENTIHTKKMMDMRSSHSSLLFSLARVLQETDPHSEAHVERTRKLAERMAEKLHLTDELTANLSLLCLLHDVGKVCIPLEILNKPTTLTEPEQELIRSHVQKGYSIVKASRDLESLADMVLHHHEKWDGSGYPGRLKKEEIPLLSRIISIIDAYDSMTNDHPYHRAVSMHEALLELEKCAGTQFDPYLVSEFAELIRESEEYRTERVNPADTKYNGYIDPEDRPDIVLSDSDTQKLYLAPVQYSRYTLTEQGDRICSVDEHFEAMTGYTPEDVETGRLTQDILIFPEDKKAYDELKEKLIVREKEAFIEHRLRMKDGSCRYVFCHGWLCYDPAMKKQRIQIIVTDMSGSVSMRNMIDSEKRMAEHNQQLLKEMVRKDPLTGLLNHTAFRNDFQEALLADDRICVMLMCDMDNFKKYNDTQGHAQGDELLKEFAKLLLENAGKQGMVCRMGGDEFAMALFYPKNTDVAMIREDVKIHWSVLDHNLSALGEYLSVSMGMGMSVGKEKNFDRVYDEADQALYQAKNQGKHRVVT